MQRRIVHYSNAEITPFVPTERTAPENLADFVERYKGFETILLCCKDVHIPRIAEQILQKKKKIEELETIAFWAQARHLFDNCWDEWDDNTNLLSRHRQKFNCECAECVDYLTYSERQRVRQELQNLTEERVCSWRIFIENIMKDLGLTFECSEVGRFKLCNIGAFPVDIIMTIESDFCSGAHGKWRGGMVCMGKTFLDNPSKRGAVLKLIDILQSINPDSRARLY